MRTGFDVEPLASIIGRFLEFAKVFRKFNEQDWSHYRHKEDYDRVFDFPAVDIQCADSIYAEGRNCAASMAYLLDSFDNIESYPTLTSYIRSLEESWIFKPEHLEDVLSKAKAHFPNMQVPLWPVEQMINLFSKQLEMLAAIRPLVIELKESDLYKQENNIPRTGLAPTLTTIINTPTFSNIANQSPSPGIPISLQDAPNLAEIVSNPEKISVSLLVQHLPIKYWIAIIFILISVISASYNAGENHIISKMISTILSSQTTNQPKNIPNIHP